MRIETAQLHGQTKWLIAGTEEDASDSDSDSDASGNESTQIDLDRLSEDVKLHVDCLMDLSDALEFPAIDAEQHDDQPSVLRLEQRAAHDYHADLILAKFPNAQIELAKCLGKISWDRYQRMQQERDSNAKGANTISATKSRAADSEFQDSGLGASLPIPSAPPTHYAGTIVSYMTSIADGKRVQIPPLPAEAKSGAAFECNACGKRIRAQNNRDWRYVSIPSSLQSMFLHH